MTVVADVPDRLPAPVESAAYFAVAECLANAVKHSGATRVTVSLVHDGSHLRAQVRDDGRGGADLDRGRRAGRGGPAAAGLRRFNGGRQPRRGPDDREDGGPVRVVVAEDHALLREGLTRILEADGFEVAAALADARDLEAAVVEHDADLAVLDVRMPPTFTNEGLVAATSLRTARPGFPVLVLSQYVEPLYAAELLASGEGAVGYLLKDRVSDVERFVAACRQVVDGGTVLDPEVVSAMIASRRSSPMDRLTDREREVLGLMAEGRSNAAIAARLTVTEKAVAKHINNVFAKLDLPLAPDDHRRVLAVLSYLDLRR